VNVLTPEGVEAVHYGFVGSTWQRTVELLAQTGLPAHLLLPHRTDWTDVDEADVGALVARVRTDMVLRLQLLDVCAAASPAAHSGQAWLYTWLASAQWAREWLHQPVPRALIPTWVTKVHGVAELEFASLACRMPRDKWAHVYAWLVHYLAASTRDGTFTPLVVPVEAGEQQHLAQWLLAHWGSLSRLSTSWQQEVPSTLALAALLPPTSCPTLDDFVACIHSLAIAAPPAPPLVPPRPPANASEMWVCTTVQSSLFPAMYLGPAGQLSFNVSDE
jgi:hypothetical protein